MVRMLRWIAGLLFLLALAPSLVFAQGRVLFAGFEDGTTNELNQDGTPRPRCDNVTAANDGLVGAHGGTRFARCLWYAGGDPEGFTTLAVPLSFNNEFLFKVWTRMDSSTDAASGSVDNSYAKILRIFEWTGDFNYYFDVFKEALSNSDLGFFCFFALSGACSAPRWDSNGVTANTPTQWHEIKYYVNMSSGIFRSWTDGVLDREYTGRNFNGVKPTNIYLHSNWHNAHALSYRYWDDVEVFSDLGSGGVGSMALGTMTQGGGGGDTTPPQVNQATIGAAGGSLALTMSENTRVGSGGNGGMSLSCSAGTVSATYSSGSGTALLSYSLSRNVLAGETCTLAYAQPGSGLEDATGNDLASFSGRATTNNSTQQLTVTASAGANGSISPASRSVNYGATASFTVTANASYDAAVGGSCGGAPSSGSGTFSYTTAPVTSLCTVSASFTLNDTSPPTISNLLPTANAASTATSVTLQATTNKAATCAHGAQGMAYASMSPYSTTGGLAHAATYAVRAGGVYQRCTRCANQSGVVSAESCIRFAVDPPNRRRVRR